MAVFIDAESVKRNYFVNTKDKVGYQRANLQGTNCLALLGSRTTASPSNDVYISHHSAMMLEA